MTLQTNNGTMKDSYVNKRNIFPRYNIYTLWKLEVLKMFTAREDVAVRGGDVAGGVELEAVLGHGGVGDGARVEARPEPSLDLGTHLAQQPVQLHQHEAVRHQQHPHLASILLL